LKYIIQSGPKDLNLIEIAWLKSGVSAVISLEIYRRLNERVRKLRINCGAQTNNNPTRS